MIELAIIWTVILGLFAFVGFFNTGKTFYNNFLKPDRPKLEIDLNLSFYHRGDIVILTQYIKILNNSQKIAFRIKLYILEGNNRLIRSFDTLKPAENHIVHERKTELDISVNPNIEATDYLKNILVIAEYKDDKGNIYYTRRKGMDNNFTLFGAKKRPKEIKDFENKFGKTQIINN